MSKILLSFIFCLITISSYSLQQFFIVSVCVVDSISNIGINKTNISIVELNKKNNTNENGCLKFAFPKGNYSFEFENKDYQSKIIQVSISSDTNIIFLLKPILKSFLFQEVIVNGNNNEKVKNLDIGLEKITSNELKNIAFLGGEKDIIKSVQYLPGVQSAYEGSANIIVRGGTPDQNLYLLDNAVVYNTNHAMGLLSSYNPSIIRGIDFYRGFIPSRLGGRISSVSDVKTKEINLTKYYVCTDLGITSGSITASIPLIKNKSALLISGRRLILDQISKFFGGIMPFYFYDISAKWVYKYDSTNVINVGYYNDKDKMTFTNLSKSKMPIETSYFYDWGNNVITSNWEYSDDKIRNIITFSISGYLMEINETRKSVLKNSFYEAKIKSKIKTISIKENFGYIFNKKIRFSSGIEYNNYSFVPANISGQSDSIKINYDFIPKAYVNELIYYIESELSIKDYFKFRIGSRFISFLTTGKYYLLLEPRLALQYNFSNSKSIKLSYVKTNQALMVLSNTGIGMPVDVWIPASGNLKPQYCNQWSIGFYSEQEKFNFNTEIYYKNISNIITYRDGYSSTDFFNSANIENNNISNLITNGKGWSIGNEWIFEKNTGFITGWVSYTLSWAKNKFNGINDGNEFWSNYDRRHNISIISALHFNKNWKLNINWQYMSGAPITAPQYWYINPNKNFIGSFSYGMGEPTLVWGQSARNSIRMKAIHHLDFSLSRKLDFKNFSGSIELGAYNIYNRKNPYYYYATINWDQTSQPKGEIKSVSLFPIIPYFNLVWYPFGR